LKAERARGIFLHTGWRSVGTWVWSRFRTQKSVMALYEPLSAQVGELNLAAISDLRPVHSSGHPRLHAPYFEEYRAFIHESRRGVDGYRRDFGIDRFGDGPDDRFSDLQSYLQHLCDRSADSGKIPVLKLCRSQGRLPWLKRAVPEVMHAGVLRNPASQFASGWLLKQEWRNAFFVAAAFRVLGLNQHEPVVRQATSTCGVKLPPVATSSHEAYAAACDSYAQTVEGSEAYKAFVALWILNAWRMLGEIDLLVDTDRLGQSPTYAAELSTQFRDHTGVGPDFNGARNLVEEAKRNARRVSGIDGRLLRAVHFSAQKFLLARMEASGSSRADIIDMVRRKFALANEIAGEWRYQ
jgi:hypothetical protein